VLLVLDGLVSIGSAMATSNSPALGGLFMRVFFCLIVFRGMKAARQVRQERALAATESL
jgi:hypothetical protein